MKKKFKSISVFGILFVGVFVSFVCSLLIFVISNPHPRVYNTKFNYAYLYIYYNENNYSPKYEDEIIFNLKNYDFKNWGDLLNGSFFLKPKNWNNLIIVHDNNTHALGTWNKDAWPFKCSNFLTFKTFWMNYKLNHKNENNWIFSKSFNNQYLQLWTSKTTLAKQGISNLKEQNLYAYVKS